MAARPAQAGGPLLTDAPDLRPPTVAEAAALLSLTGPVQLQRVDNGVPGWTVQILEQQANNILIRPLTLYTGPAMRPYVPIGER